VPRTSFLHASKNGPLSLWPCQAVNDHISLERTWTDFSVEHGSRIWLSDPGTLVFTNNKGPVGNDLG